MTTQTSTTTWGSRIGFILASTGSAVGLGAIWKFPYMAGNNGGSAFILAYILFSLTIGIAMLISEFAIGRAGRQGAMGSLKAVAGRGWSVFGFIGALTGFTILCFYSCVGGWCLKYLVDSLSGAGTITDAQTLNAHFGAFVSNGPVSFGYLLAFLLINLYIVDRGVVEGIEKLSKYLMPLLFILMLAMIVRGLTLPGAMEGVRFLFVPDFDKFDMSVVFNAMGFTFFSLSLGAGTMVTYGSYLSKEANLPTSTLWVAVLAALTSILGGLMVMPAVFAFGLDPAAGPGLTFVTMPAVFANMPLGEVFAVVFYICLVVAALTSSVSMLEAATTVLTKDFGVQRRFAVVALTFLAAVIGLFCTLSFGTMSDVKIFGKTIFDALDYLTSNIGMPLSELGFALVAGWVSWKVVRSELLSARKLPEWLLKSVRFGIAVLSPLLIFVVVATNI